MTEAVMQTPGTAGLAGTGAAINDDAGHASHVMECSIKELYYGDFLAVRPTDCPIKSRDITAFVVPLVRPSGMTAEP